jgi:hypothetical protein
LHFGFVEHDSFKLVAIPTLKGCVPHAMLVKDVNFRRYGHLTHINPNNWQYNLIVAPTSLCDGKELGLFALDDIPKGVEVVRTCPMQRKELHEWEAIVLKGIIPADGAVYDNGKMYLDTAWFLAGGEVCVPQWYYINHGKKTRNVKPRLVPRAMGELIMVYKSVKEIKSGDELRFDYNKYVAELEGFSDGPSWPLFGRPD